MHQTQKHLASFLLTGALIAPLGAALVALPASAAPQDDRGVYDRDHKDYHKWDDHEQSAWSRYLAEKHRKEHEFTKASHKEQQQYWNWRHDHPD